jgi:hypothetical protein
MPHGDLRGKRARDPVGEWRYFTRTRRRLASEFTWLTDRRFEAKLEPGHFHLGSARI